MKLSDYAVVTQGVFINRIEVSNLNEDSIRVQLLTLKEFNETLGLDYRISKDKDHSVFVKCKKITPGLKTDTNSLVMHTLSQKVALLPEKYSGLVLTNNFVKITFKNKVDLHFIEWLINEHPTIQKQIVLFSQGSIIPSLKLSNIKDIELVLPSYEKQQVLGKIAVLKRKKAQLLKEKIDLEQQLLHQKLINCTK
ncbi:restriction endonuclease subunit S [Bacillus wiedmannii]|uniref:restriction endonuclease subunit S n=1 Tax=Bacillus wiedmannii TaxID=1890302 RepID=UPI000BF2E505|nr:restriction endonuclease subunit S [Bacillus wiedmannii]PFZ52859.1 restriction endonuclease subunit S [Bacillus wiedmannii]